MIEQSQLTEVKPVAYAIAQLARKAELYRQAGQDRGRAIMEQLVSKQAADEIEALIGGDVANDVTLKNEAQRKAEIFRRLGESPDYGPLREREIKAKIAIVNLDAECRALEWEAAAARYAAREALAGREGEEV
jgi:hypothetical protein